MSLTSIIIRWTGPWSVDEVVRSKKGKGIYLLAGKKPYERKEQIQYCGITEGLFRTRIHPDRDKILQIKQETLTIWLGKIIYPVEPERSHLEKAETCLVSFWYPVPKYTPTNQRKIRYFPAEPICVISQWCTKDDKPRLNRPPIVKELPDLLWWDAERKWRTGKLKVR